MGNFEKGNEAPKNAQDVMGDMMPKAEQLKTGETPQEVKDLSKGYPKVDPKSYKEAYNDCKAKIDSTKRGGMGETNYITATEMEWTSGDDGKMHGHEFLLVRSKDGKSEYFFRNPKEETKKMKAMPAEDYAANNIKNPKEMSDAAKVVKLAKALKSKLTKEMGAGHPRSCSYETSQLVDAGIIKKGEIAAKVIFAIEDPNMNKKIRIFTGSDFA